MTMVYDGNICKITHEGLKESLFAVSPVWCECFAPSEIDFLVKCGESRSFLKSHLIDKEASSDTGKTYYSWPLGNVKAQKAPLPEFVHVSAKFDILGKRFAGFLWLVSGELTGVSIFLEGEDIDLSLNEELREDNCMALLELVQSLEDLYFLIPIHLSELTSNLVDYAEARIPV